MPTYLLYKQFTTQFQTIMNDNLNTISPNVQCMRAAKAGLSGGWLMAAVATLVYMVIIGAASYTFLGVLLLYGPLTYGYIAYLRAQNDNKVQDFSLLFKGFNNFVETMVAGLLYTLIIIVGTILLIVPGIIAALGLSMTFFIMVERPGITGVEALKMSWEMMMWHKWEFFEHNLRFIGWMLLAVLTGGIGDLWLEPYMYTAYLHYYRRLAYGGDLRMAETV